MLSLYLYNIMYATFHDQKIKVIYLMTNNL